MGGDPTSLNMLLTNGLVLSKLSGLGGTAVCGLTAAKFKWLLDLTFVLELVACNLPASLYCFCILILYLL